VDGRDGVMKRGVPDLLRLPYYVGNWRANQVFDLMHAAGGLVKDTFNGTLTGEAADLLLLRLAAHLLLPRFVASCRVATFNTLLERLQGGDGQPRCATMNTA